MSQIIVPTLGESVSEATVAKWLKKEGEAVTVDEPIVELETDKVTLEIGAPVDGVITSVVVQEGQDVEVGALLGEIEAGAVANDTKPAAQKDAVAVTEATNDQAANVSGTEQTASSSSSSAPSGEVPKMSPSVRKLVRDHGVDVASIPASGKDGRLTKADVQGFLDAGGANAPVSPPASESVVLSPRAVDAREERVKMTKLRRVIAKRLKDSQNTAAILTTFNEVDMGPVMDLRKEYQDAFVKKHGVKLGFMSFFVKAAIQALKEFPALNAEIDGDDIIYKNYYDIGVAVSTPQGLVVPVLRDADQLSMAEIELAIVDLGTRAREGKLTMDEMSGGTYTITNGGTFGSMLSTPILNAPQSGILGMHNIVKRPMVMKDGSIEARPIMYLAQSYDHRIVDGREAVSTLVRMKQAIEDPQRLILDV